jgi:hypothetical protein
LLPQLEQESRMGCTSNVYHANKHLESHPREYVDAMLAAWGRPGTVADALERPLQLIRIGRAIQAHMRYHMAWRSDPNPDHAASRALAQGWLQRKGDGVVLSQRALGRIRQAEAGAKRWRTRRLNSLVKLVAERVAQELL